MARSDFKSLIAPKPVVRKIEQYKRTRGLPSRSQALTAILNEVERNEQLRGILRNFYELLKDLAGELERLGSNSISQLVTKVLNSMLELLKSISLDGSTLG